MVSAYGLYKAFIEVFGVMSVYFSAIISIIGSIYFVLGFIAQIIFSVLIYVFASNYLVVTESPLTIIIKLVLSSLITNLFGLAGFIYFLINFKNYKRLFSKDNTLTEKEMKISIIYVLFNIILFIIYFYTLKI